MLSVVCQVVNTTFYKIYYFCASRDLEQQRLLDPDCELDLFVLHHVFMPLLQREVKIFIDSWNHHKLRTEGNLSPMQLFVSGLSRQTEAELQDFMSSHDVNVDFLFFNFCFANCCYHHIASFPLFVQLLSAFVRNQPQKSLQCGYCQFPGSHKNTL